MALQKNAVAVNFAQGIDTKSDPYQIQIGKFFALQNSVFTSTGRLTKRNGFPLLTTLPDTSQTTLTTLNDNLIATGTSLYAYSADSNQWLNQGNVQPVQLSTQALVRNSTNQTQPDAAVAPNGLVCFVYVDGAVAYYQISDSRTGQQVLARTSVGNASATNPRVFVLGPYFIVTFMATVSAATHLQYITIPIATPSSPGMPVDISTSVSGLTAGYDGYVVNNSLFLGWDGAGTTVQLTRLSSTLAQFATTTISGHSASLMSVTADTSQATPVIWFTFWDSPNATMYTVAYNQIFNIVRILTAFVDTTGHTVNTLTSAATAQRNNIFYEYANTYTYAPNNITNYVNTRTITQSGTTSNAAVVLRSVGLASKAFVGPNSVVYMLVAYGEASQKSYFLIDSSGNIYMRLAYSNGGGYATNQVLPSVSFSNGVYYAPYLNNDFLASVNKGTNLPAGTPTTAIYTQTGVNLAKMTFSLVQYNTQIANSLQLTGGQLWEYDGVKPVELGFQVWPDNVAVFGSNTAGGLVAGVTYYWQFTYEWTDNQGILQRSAPSIPVTYTPLSAPVSFTGNRTNGTNTLTSVSSFAGLQVGQPISGTGIPMSTYITALNPGTSTVTMSAFATSGTSTSTTVTPTSVSSVVLDVPNLRLTYKIAPNPVRIVGYRWSTSQQVYYQFTSLTSPVVNDTTTDSQAIPDTNSDSAILGNVLLYTTGGVLENIAAPASIASALFNNRLFMIDAEDQNLLWFSKQVIENVPVEMSDLLTIYVAPTTGVQGSTGPMTALSAMDDKLIIFKKDAAYYINGSGPDNTGSNSTFSDPVFITSSVGCSNPNSIVMMPAGLMFQSDKGIWLLGRDLQTRYIGAPVESYNSQTVVSAQSIPATTQVRFVLSNNVTLMYDYYYDQWATHTNLYALSSTLYQGAQTYLNKFGQVLQETPGTWLDASNPVLMSLTTSWINLAGLQGFERFYFMYILGTYFTPFKLNVQVAYDYNPSPPQATVVQPSNFAQPWGGEAQWGSGGAWGGTQYANVFEARVFPQQQKCEAFQVTITEVFDPALSAAPGQGLSLSGLNLIVGTKRGYRTQSAGRSFG